MAISKTYHARSNSFPSTSHPVTLAVEDNLCRLKASHTTSSVSSNLENLKNLHTSLNDLVELPSIQQDCCERLTDEAVDGSLRLLDVCSNTKDIMVLVKESVKELESSLRRNRGGESSLTKEIYAYKSSGKNIKKMVTKTIKQLKKFEKISSSTLGKQDKNLVPTLTMVQESEIISFLILKSILLHHKENKVDDALSTLISKKCNKENKFVRVQNVVKQLENFEMNIRQIEEVLEAIFRSLIKRRVSLLNAINH